MDHLTVSAEVALGRKTAHLVIDKVGPWRLVLMKSCWKLIGILLQGRNRLPCRD